MLRVWLRLGSHDPMNGYDMLSADVFNSIYRAVPFISDIWKK